jgi:hypothetical protein
MNTCGWGLSTTGPYSSVPDRIPPFGGEPNGARLYAHETFILGGRFPNLTNPVLARRCSRVLLELQAPSCTGMTLFAALWPVIGQ